MTIELASATRMPSRREISRIWVDLVRWLLQRFPERRRPLTAEADAASG